MKGLLQTGFFKYPVEVLRFALILGISIGVILGFVEAWVYASNGFFLPDLNLLKHHIDKSILIVFIYASLYLITFFNLRGVTGNTKKTCLISGTIVLIPLFIFLI